MRSPPSPATAAKRSHEPGLEQLAQPAGDQVEQPVELRLGRERIADLVERLELLRPARRGLVEPGILDRDRGLAREHRDELLVFGGEVLAALLLGEVEIPVRDPA
jgi:hypothetical protein